MKKSGDTLAGFLGYGAIIALVAFIGYGLGWLARWAVGCSYPPANNINVWAFVVVIWLLCIIFKGTTRSSK